MLRRRLMMMVQNLFFWIRIKDTTVMGRKAKGERAPAEVVTSRRAMRFGRPVHAGDYPAEDIVAKRGAVIGVDASVDAVPADSIIFARAMRMSRTQPFSFRIHPITALKGLLMSRKADGDSAPGRLAEVRMSMQTGHKTAGERADTKLTRSKRALRMGYKAVTNGYVGQPEEVGRAMGMSAEVDPTHAPPEDFSVQRATGMGRKVKADTWIEPVILEDGSLLIRQAYYAEMIDGILEVS